MRKNRYTKQGFQIGVCANSLSIKENHAKPFFFGETLLVKRTLLIQQHVILYREVSSCKKDYL